MITNSLTLSMNAKLFARKFFGGVYGVGANPEYRNAALTPEASEAFRELREKGYIKWYRDRNYIRIEREIPQTVSWKAARNKKMLESYQIYAEPSLLNHSVEIVPTTSVNDYTLRQEILNTLSRMATIQAALFFVLDQKRLKPDMYPQLNQAVRLLNGLGAPKILEDALAEIEPE